MSKLLWFFWLALLQSAFGFAIPNKVSFSAPHSTKIICFCTITYDEQNPVKNVYDVVGLADFGYDSAAVLTAYDKENRTVGTSSLLARFANFLAAEGGGVQLTQQGLDVVGNHLAQFDEFAPNTQMMQNLQDAFDAGQPVTGANANFYLHETSEAAFMGNGLSYDAAHAAALEQYGVSPFSLYTPEVIQANPTLFNNAWRTAAGLPPLP